MKGRGKLKGEVGHRLCLRETGREKGRVSKRERSDISCAVREDVSDGACARVYVCVCYPHAILVKWILAVQGPAWGLSFS